MKPMQPRSPSFSIIVTCYNYARYVEQALESALCQSYPDKQIVVVNDGSSDDSLEVISRYADRVTIIDQPNAGSIAAYNRGYQASSGDVIVLLDADDVLAPDALTQVAAVWTSKLAKVQWDLRIIDTDGRDLGRKFCHFDEKYDASRVRQAFRRTGTYRWPVSVGNAYSRWFADALFPLSPAHGPDGALNTVAPVYGDVATVARPLASYRIHGRNLWSTTANDFGRLPERIRQRLDEVELMQRHARRRGVDVPSGSVLDHEIAFVNYRMMAQALGLDYPGCADDSRPRLLRQALRVLQAERYPAQLALAHAAWFSALSVAPQAAAEALIRRRFSRNARSPSA
jgi:glycosyltransferase involved in cell wall biosynthesis